VDVNAPFTAGKYAVLCLAASKENVLLIKLLLDSGINPNLKTERGKSALSKAIKLKRKDIQDLLIENGAAV
jgi:ankyrin repeat protein